MDCSHVFDFKVNRLIVAFTLFLAFFAVVPSVYAQTENADSALADSAHVQPAEAAHGEGKFDPTAVVMEHIADSHVWHVAGNFSFPLPVILYTPSGLEVFSSGEFHHGEEDYKGRYNTYRLEEETKGQSVSQNFFNKQIKVVG